MLKGLDVPHSFERTDHPYRNFVLAGAEHCSYEGGQDTDPDQMSGDSEPCWAVAEGAPSHLLEATSFHSRSSLEEDTAYSTFVGADCPRICSLVPAECQNSPVHQNLGRVERLDHESHTCLGPLAGCLVWEADQKKTRPEEIP